MGIDPRRPITEQLQEPPKPLEPLTIPVITHIACRECGGVATMRTPSHPGARFCSVQCIYDLEKRLVASEPIELQEKVDSTDGPLSLTLPTTVGSAGQVFMVKKKEGAANWVTIARTGGDQLITGFGQVHLTPQPEDEREETFGVPEQKTPYRVWTSWLEGNLCGELHIIRADLPRDRQAMRQLLHARLQAFGDALMVEYEKQVFEEDT